MRDSIQQSNRASRRKELNSKNRVVAEDKATSPEHVAETMEKLHLGEECPKTEEGHQPPTEEGQPSLEMAEALAKAADEPLPADE